MTDVKISSMFAKKDGHQPPLSNIILYMALNYNKILVYHIFLTIKPS